MSDAKAPEEAEAWKVDASWSALVPNPSMEVAVHVTLRLRDQSLHHVVLDVHAHPRLAALAELLIRGDVDTILDGGADDEVLASLEKQGILVPAADAPEEARFDPVITVGDPLGIELEAGHDAAELERNDDVRVWPDLDTSNEPFSEVLTHERARPDGSSDLYLVPQRLGNPIPTRLDPELDRHWQAVCGGGVDPADLPAEVRQIFAAANLLRAPSDLASEVAALGQHLADDQYVVLRGMVAPGLLPPLRRYCRQLRRHGYLIRGDEQVLDRWVQHDNPVMRCMHRSLVPLVASITTHAFAPCEASYSYFSTYIRGAELERHRDRSQCRWNLSVVLDAEPDVPRGTLWPIHLGTPNGDVAVDLRPGDGLLYSGTELPHWRAPLDRCEAISCCFFHFVDPGFTGRRT